MLFRKMFTVSAVSLTLLASSPVIALESSVEQTKPFTHEEIQGRVLPLIIRPLIKGVVSGIGLSVGKDLYDKVKDSVKKKKEASRKE